MFSVVTASLLVLILVFNGRIHDPSLTCVSHAEIVLVITVVFTVSCGVQIHESSITVLVRVYTYFFEIHCADPIDTENIAESMIGIAITFQFNMEDFLLGAVFLVLFVFVII